MLGDVERGTRRAVFDRDVSEEQYAGPHYIVCPHAQELDGPGNAAGKRFDYQKRLHPRRKK
jgi:hypothetical protein